MSLIYFIVGWVVIFGFINIGIFFIQRYVNRRKNVIAQQVQQAMMANPHNMDIINGIFFSSKKSAKRSKKQGHPSTNLFK